MIAHIVAEAAFGLLLVAEVVLIADILTTNAPLIRQALNGQEGAWR